MADDPLAVTQDSTSLDITTPDVMPPDVTTCDAFYGGKLVIRQPARGHRSGTDAILLAAAVPRDFAGLACDVGAGVGVAGLGVALACSTARVRLIERDASAARLARENIAVNDLSERCDVLCRDLFCRRDDDGGGIERADLVVTNPPFWEARQVRASPHRGRSAAHVLDAETTLSDWLEACLDLLGAKGTLIVVHAPAAVPDLLAAFDRRLGGVTLLPIHPQAEAPAKRVLVRGTRGCRTPLSIAPPLVLHEAGRFTAAAERLHRGEAGLSW